MQGTKHAALRNIRADPAPISRGAYGIYLNRNPKLPVILEAPDVVNAGTRISVDGFGTANEIPEDASHGHEPSSRIEYGPVNRISP